MEDVAPSLKQQYFAQQIREAIADIAKAQYDIAAHGIYRRGHAKKIVHTGKRLGQRSGNLVAALQSPQYIIGAAGKGVEAYTEIPLYMRFLDMKQHGNYHIYNRPVWGTLYKQTFQDIKYEFRDWLKDFAAKSLKGVFNGDVIPL